MTQDTYSLRQDKLTELFYLDLVQEQKDLKTVQSMLSTKNVLITFKQGPLRKVSHLSIILVIVITLVLLTSCDIMGISKLWCHV